MSHLEGGMTTTKRCEVCGLPPCNLWMTGCEGRCHCNGHSSPPPRPDEIEKELENLLGGGADEMPRHHTDCSYRPDFKKKLKFLLLSYGKEREKEMFRKCWEAVEKQDAESFKYGWKDGIEIKRLLHESKNQISALNPDNSSPDEGREGRV